jgi:hypothetical protein
MSLLKAGIYNDIPTHMSIEMPKQGTVVSWQITSEPTDEIINDKPVKRYPMTYIFPTNHKIYDEKERKTIPIAIVKGKDKDGNPTEIHKIRFSPFRTKGIYSITIGEDDIQDQIYEYLMLIEKYHAGNGEIGFKYIDKAAKAESDIVSLESKYEAYIKARSLKDEELKDVALIFNIDSNQDIKVMRAEIYKYADTNPKDFKDKIDNDDSRYKALIKEGLNTGVLYIEKGVVKWKQANATMFEMRTEEPAMVGDEYVHYVKTSELGAKSVDLLKSMIDKEAKKSERQKNKQ